MELPTERPPIPAWRSQAFVRPLVIGLVGVAASFAVASIAMDVLAPCESYGCIQQVFVRTFVYFPLVFVPGLLITGFLAAVSSPGAGTALAALALAVLVDWLAGSVALAIASGSEAAGLVVFLGVLVALGALPLALGFGVGRVVRRRWARHPPGEAG